MRFPDFNQIPPMSEDMLKERVELENKAYEIQEFISRTIERSVAQFVELVDGRTPLPHEIKEHGRFVTMPSGSNDRQPHFEKFFIYKQNVLAYSILASEMTEDGKPGMTLDYTVRTQCIPYAELPEAIKAQLG